MKSSKSIWLLVIAALPPLLPPRAAADDLEILPPPGGALVIKDQTGQNVHFQVNESGEVIIGGKLVDAMPPTIDIIAPAIAEQELVDIEVHFADDTELLAVKAAGPDTGPLDVLLAPGTSQFIGHYTARSALGETTTMLFSVSDLDGNAVKASHTINTPTPDVAAGTYQLAEPILTPLIPAPCLPGDAVITVDQLTVSHNWADQSQLMNVAIGGVLAGPPPGPGVFPLGLVANYLPYSAMAFAATSDQFGASITANLSFADTDPLSGSLTLTIDCSSVEGEIWGPYQSGLILVP